MKYYGTYACGHEGVVEIYGPSKDREAKRKMNFLARARNAENGPDSKKETSQTKRQRKQLQRWAFQN